MRTRATATSNPVTTTPAGPCPVRLTGTDGQAVREWVAGVLAEGQERGVHYAAEALRYRVREFHDYGTPEYEAVCAHLDGLLRGEAASAHDGPADAADGPGDQAAESPAAPAGDVPGPGELACHEVTALFPEMTAEEYAQLREDIRAHGQREPIRTHGGKIVDGRHRYRACRDLGIDPRLEEWAGTGSLVAYVVSANVNRRHLDPSQRAMIAAKVKGLFEQEARQRQLAGRKQKDLPLSSEEGQCGESAEQAAKRLGVGKDSVYKAQKVLRSGAPALQEAVTQGQLSVSAAAPLADLPHEEQVATVGRGAKAARQKASHLRSRTKAKKPAARARARPARRESADGLRVASERRVLLWWSGRWEDQIRRARRAANGPAAQRAAVLQELIACEREGLSRAEQRLL
jgi:hypothetical protein